MQNGSKAVVDIVASTGGISVPRYIPGDRIHNGYSHTRGPGFRDTGIIHLDQDLFTADASHLLANGGIVQALTTR